MTGVWTDEQAQRFWQTRSTYLVFRYDEMQENITIYNNELQRQIEIEDEKKKEHISNRTFLPPVRNVCEVNQVEKTSSDLVFWTKYSSWTFCKTCKLLSTNILSHNFPKRVKNKAKRTCVCSQSRYTVPRYKDIPECLLNLTIEDINVLRPFYLFAETYERQQHGYRVKCCPIKIRTSPKSVREKIDELSNTQQKLRCENAYAYLVGCHRSRYGHFVDYRETILHEGKDLNMFNFQETQGIECALWPNLYPFTSWCESIVCDGGTRRSGKVSFTAKLFSELTDYSLHFQLLQFQYDRWLFKTVSGAINTARYRKCSPARALDTKSFSATYWQWQHRYLLDAVSQFGLPDIFITLSPYEWSFPFPQWLLNIRQNTGKPPTELAGYETAHIVHTLAQIVRGYLCGSNSSKWSKHLFSYNRISTHANVKTFFYRFEFQKRGTVHLHLLVWLNDITKIQHQLIRADIPNDNANLSYLVTKYQTSDKPSNALKMQESESYFDINNDKRTLHLKHPADAFAVNLRAYISTLLPTLHCSMDFQTGNGRAMLLKYVTSYVTKNQDGIDVDSLYSYNVSGGQAAVRYVMDMKPAEPEMWLALSSTKISWSNSRTKRYVLPSSENADVDKTVEKYRNRPQVMNDFSLLNWLRTVNHSNQVPKVYQHGTTLVGLKIFSFFNKEYFFQYLLANLPHRSHNDLTHPNHFNIPDNLKWYAGAVHHFTEFWQDDNQVSTFLSNQGHRDTYISTCIAYLHTLADTFLLWQTEIISRNSFDTDHIHEGDAFTLDNQQRTIYNHVISSVNKRGHHYSTFANVDSLQSGSDSEDVNMNDHIENPLCATEPGENLDVVWNKPVLITGPGGCGKSYVIKHVVNRLIQKNASVLIAAPTGFLTSVFRSSFPDDVDCNTVHASFKFPISENEPAVINWQLSNYDVIIIDEISMIPILIFQHILKTLNVLIFRPILVLCGDAAQQQPFTRAAGKVMQMKSPFDETSFLQNTYRYNLTKQHRVVDSIYFSFLQTIRKWVPSQTLLDEIQDGRVIGKNDVVSDDDILQGFLANPCNTVLTFTRNAANRVNLIIVNALFKSQQPLLLAQLDCDLPPKPIYKGMRILLTQNRDKNNGIVNGQLAIVDMVQNRTVFVKFASGKVVPIYPVTVKQNDIKRTVYPFMHAYATTICKAQGQTIDKVLLWLDIDAIPAGTAYVALSRVRSRQDILFLNKLQPKYFTPVSRLSHLL